MEHKIFVICDFDGDSGMTHPVTGESIQSVGGLFILKIRDKGLFLEQLMNNSFMLSERVYDSLMLCIDNGYFFYEGNYYAGNYSIKFYDMSSAVEV